MNEAVAISRADVNVSLLAVAEAGHAVAALTARPRPGEIAGLDVDVRRAVDELERAARALCGWAGLE